MACSSPDAVVDSGALRPTSETRGWLGWLCAARTFLCLGFLTYAACLPALRVEWGMSATRSSSIAMGFQLGYAVSLAAFSWLAGRIGARRIFIMSASLSAASGILFGLFARSYASALLLYTIVGLTQGGTYSAGVLLAAEGCPRSARGTAVGWLTASSSLGYVLSLAISGYALKRSGYPLAFLATAAAGPVLGLALAWRGLGAVPNLVHRRPDDRHFRREVLRNRLAVSLIIGYVAHAWELLGMWAWTPAFLAACAAASGSEGIAAVSTGAFLAASFHMIGLLASASMGQLADRFERPTVVLALASCSAVGSLVFGWTIGWPMAIIVAIGAAYAFTALGDSPGLAAELTRVVNPAYLGSAFALRQFAGYLAGAAAPVAFGAVLDATNPAGTAPVGWGWAFGTLAIGGAVATIAIYAAWRRSTGSTAPAVDERRVPSSRAGDHRDARRQDT